MKKFLALVLSVVMLLGVMTGAMTVFAEEPDPVIVEFSEYEFAVGQIPVMYILAHQGNEYVTGAKFTIKDSEGSVLFEANENEGIFVARMMLPAYATPGKKDLQVTVTKGNDTLVENFKISVFIKYGAPSDNLFVFDNGTATREATKTTVNINTSAGIVGLTIPAPGVTAEKEETRVTKYDGQTYAIENVTVYVPDTDKNSMLTFNFVAPEGTRITAGKLTYALNQTGEAVLTNFPINSSIDVVIPASENNYGIALQISIESAHMWDGYSFDDEYHWHECEACGEIFDKEAHDLNAKGACKVCKYKKADEQFTLSFETNGGTAIAALVREKGKKLNIVNAVPERLGYTFDGWYFDKEFTEKADVVELNANTTVYAKWIKADNPFKDVKADDVYYSDVMYVYNKGLMIGLTKDTFGQWDSITRAMIVTILYRLEGEPAFMNDNMFKDVVSGSYYEKAVIWANGKGIVNGYPGNTFAPDKAISRQELMTIIYRYCQYKEYALNNNEDTNTLDFDDIMDVAEYALPAVHWGTGLAFDFSADNNRILPRENATRAFAANVFHNLCEKVVK